MFKVGDIVKIKERLKFTSWYHNNEMRIVDIKEHTFGGSGNIIDTDYIFSDGTGTIHEFFLELVSSNNRKDRINKLFSD